HQRTGRDKRKLTDAHVVEQNRTDANQRSAFDVATVQRHAVPNSDFFFENRRVASVLHVNHAVVLKVGAIADANVVNVAAHGAVTPDRRLFPEVYVADNLSARVNVRSRMNLRVNPTKWSNHKF